MNPEIDLTQPNIIKFGKNSRGEQLYFDKTTRTKFNPATKVKKFTEEEKLEAVYSRVSDSASLSGIARRIGVVPSTVLNWTRKYTSQLAHNEELGLSNEEQSSDMKRIEIDELYSHVKKKSQDSMCG
mgnify:CR=1 FL=1